MKAARHAHTHPSLPEHEFEPQHGLPEVLPESEKILWQGSPDWRQMALRSFHVRKVAVYFAVLLALRVLFDLSDGQTLAQSLVAVTGLSLVALLALAILSFMAWMSATQAVYTLTDRRVVMRIGIVLTVTYNLPFKHIEAAALQKHPGGTGDLPLVLTGGQRIAVLHLWPHVRPWQFRRPQPMLRCVPDAERVAALLATAWSAARGEAAQTVAAAAPSHAGSHATSPAPAKVATAVADDEIPGTALRPVLLAGRAG